MTVRAGPHESADGAHLLLAPFLNEVPGSRTCTSAGETLVAPAFAPRTREQLRGDRSAGRATCRAASLASEVAERCAIPRFEQRNLVVDHAADAREGRSAALAAVASQGIGVKGEECGSLLRGEPRDRLLIHRAWIGRASAGPNVSRYSARNRRYLCSTLSGSTLSSNGWWWMS